MNFILKEREARRQQQKQDLKFQMIKEEAKRYGASMKEPEKSEKEFIYKIRAIHHLFSADIDATLVANDVSIVLRNHELPTSIPMSQVDPNILLDLL